MPCYAKGDFINHLQLKHKNHPGTGRDPIANCEKGNKLFWDYKKRSDNHAKLYHALLTISSPHQWNQREFFSHGTICHKTQKKTEWWECALIVMRQCYEHNLKTNLINNSLINCTLTNSTVATSPVVLRWLCGSPRTGDAWRITPFYMWREQAIEREIGSMISIFACCHGAKLCAHAARDFRSQ